jgi:ectoine hydroxylase-related dioxygenase (phytanoyl-CoA dioxygenase family)
MFSVDCKRDEQWLTKAIGALRHFGYVLVENVVPDDLLERTPERMYKVQKQIRDELGEERLARAGELGVLRIMLRYDPLFFEYLEIPEMLRIVDSTVSETAILHLQNGFILPPQPESANGSTFQQTFHRDFPRYLNGYLASLNVLFAIDAFSAENGGTIVVPGTHQRPDRPDDEFLRAAAEAVECPAGSAIVFDSTLWHAAGVNRSRKDRLGLNQQFTRSFFKQQVDYVRALGDDVVQQQADRTQQLLGWYTRVVTSLDDYYRPAEERLYRSGQG